MKIWIDFINSPQVCFFEPLIDDLTKEGHEIILTCRDSANTVDLLKQRKWSFKIIGNSVKKSTVKKLFSAPGRILALRQYLKDKKIDVAISQSGFYLPLTARLLGVPSVYTNDNEHALGNIPAFIFANKIILPENFSINKALKRGARRSKISIYPGVKEEVYLWPRREQIQNERKIRNRYIKTIFVRTEPATAQYYTGKKNFLDSLLMELKDRYAITVLTRGKSQLDHYRQPQFSGVNVPTHPLPFDEVATSCSLFIGAGGSMTREMALMNVPTVSVYQDELLGVDKFLISKGLMIHKDSLSPNDVEEILRNEKKTTAKSENILAQKGKEAYNLIKETILNIKK